ncbi:FixH family protein [Lysobacter sp. A6]|uniref:FixH family protein n=1 Tax=Noviluteimonas lactosilytica TaxID=2888523 RepID=A0ABS8JGF2_9GAMM|nr:FixH family protein [Lysobacter lactosilyticus]MCC8362686.1 FixH family protein [Lysobacter lactosilyticus]
MIERPPLAPWRQPLVWLVFSLPALSVVAGLALLWLAEGPIDAVADPVKRTAQVQDTDLAPDLEARRLGLSAQVRRVGRVFDVVPAGEGFDRAVQLELVLRHPVIAAEDMRIALTPSTTGWSGHVESFDEGHDWLVELAPMDRSWRLRGRWEARAAGADVQPALASAQ